MLQHGEQLLRNISSITRPTLLSLNLGSNSILWKNEMRFKLLLDVLQQLHNLEKLNLDYNNFSATHTELLLRKISECDVL